MQSLLFTPFDLSHLKKSSSDMELLNIRLCVDGATSASGVLFWSIEVKFNNLKIADVMDVKSALWDQLNGEIEPTLTSPV